MQYPLPLAATSITNDQRNMVAHAIILGEQRLFAYAEQLEVPRAEVDLLHLGEILSRLRRDGLEQRVNNMIADCDAFRRDDETPFLRLVVSNP